MRKRSDYQAGILASLDEFKARTLSFFEGAIYIRVFSTVAEAPAGAFSQRGPQLLSLILPRAQQK